MTSFQYVVASLSLSFQYAVLFFSIQLRDVCLTPLSPTDRRLHRHSLLRTNGLARARSHNDHIRQNSATFCGSHLFYSTNRTNLVNENERNRLFDYAPTIFPLSPFPFPLSPLHLLPSFRSFRSLRPYFFLSSHLLCDTSAVRMIVPSILRPILFPLKLGHSVFPSTNSTFITSTL